MHRLWKMIRRVRWLISRYAHLPKAERQALWHAARWIVAVRSALEIISFRRVLNHIEARAQRHLPSRPSQHEPSPRAGGLPALNEFEQDSGEQQGTAQRPGEQQRVHGRRDLETPPAVHRTPAAARTIWAVDAVGRRLMPERPCLTQALVGRLLLARDGIDVSLHIGVMKDQDALKAHAWLEQDDTVILGGERSREKYRAFPALGGQSSGEQ